MPHSVYLERTCYPYLLLPGEVVHLKKKNEAMKLQHLGQCSQWLWFEGAGSLRWMLRKKGSEIKLLTGIANAVLLFGPGPIPKQSVLLK